MSMQHQLSVMLLGAVIAAGVQAQPLAGDGAAVYLDFNRANKAAELRHGLKTSSTGLGATLEFTTPLHLAEVPFGRKLDGARAATVGGWFFPRRSGEQNFLFRGAPETGPNGERFFRRPDAWVSFVLGTDHRGFFLGTINGNGQMPFPHVTVEEVPINSWSQLVVVKTADGFQKFYRNGTLVHSDSNAVSAPKIWPFKDQAEGEALRLSMPFGGMIGEAWVYPRELSAEEIRADFHAKTNRYFPALPSRPVLLREMNAQAAAGLWPQPVTERNWPAARMRLLQGATNVLGTPPVEKPPLDPRIISEHDCGSYVRRKVSIEAQPGDRMPLYLLIPKPNRSPLASLISRGTPAIICFYGTSGGAGKDTTVGLSGRVPGSEPHANMAFAVDMAEAGFVAVAPDYLRDGERIKPGRRPYDTTDFYKEFPDWSIHGKDIWDTSRVIDYLETLKFVDARRIGMVGHSYGGHSTIFATAMEPRIKVAVANGPVSDFRHHGRHWAARRAAATASRSRRCGPTCSTITCQSQSHFINSRR